MPKRRESPRLRPADANGVCSQRESLEDVSAATEPAFDQDRHLSSDRLDHLREGLDRTGAFLAPAAMVMLERFPRLKERRYELAGTLSGGERQMLALAKVLIRKPQLVLMDEPSIGLAPTVVEGLQRIVADISRDGLAVIAAEQNVSWVAPLAARAFLLESGSFVAEGPPDEIIHRERVIESFLGQEIQ